MIKEQIQLSDYNFVSDENKEFIVAFTDAMEKSGYYTDGFTDGICWGKYMLIYRKSGVKSKKVFARIYIRENSICLRLFFSDITEKGEYIKNAPDFIKDVFVGSYGTCKHCRGDNCRFRKDYEIDGVKYEKCNGTTFQFFDPNNR